MSTAFYFRGDQCIKERDGQSGTHQPATGEKTGESYQSKQQQQQQQQ